MNWFTREKRLIAGTSLYTGALVYTHNWISYLFAAAYVLFMIIFMAN